MLNMAKAQRKRENNVDSAVTIRLMAVERWHTKQRYPLYIAVVLQIQVWFCCETLKYMQLQCS